MQKIVKTEFQNPNNFFGDIVDFGGSVGKQQIYNFV
jgi:hypothetical protein